MTAIETAPAASTPSQGQTASTTTPAPVAPESAPEGKSPPVQEQKTPLGHKPSDAKPAAESKPFTLKTPKGVEFDAGALDSYTKFANELQLEPEKAQGLLDKFAPVLHERQKQQVVDAQETWDKEAKADPEIGGKHRDAVLKTANEALSRFGTDKLHHLLSESGLNLHPEVIRLFHKIGSLIGEDRVVTKGEPVKAPAADDFKSIAEVMYPSANKKK